MKYLRSSRSIGGGSRRHGRRLRQSAARWATFEPLEPRLVLSAQVDSGLADEAVGAVVLSNTLITLGPSPTAEVVNIAPGLLPGEFDVTFGPAVVGNGAARWYATFGGEGVYQTAGANASVQSDDFFSVDLAESYALTGFAKSGDEFGQRFQPANLQSFGVMAYDADLQLILPQHVLRFDGAADTTLAAPLNPGDTTIQLTDATGWSNSPGAAAETRGLAWYGYADSTGHTYADYTYTRNVATGGAGGLWQPGAVSGNAIMLAEPWDGPALPAGTAVRNTGDGTAETFLALDSQSVPADWTWTQYAGTFGGQVIQDGIDAVGRFRPGTAYVKPVIVANQHAAADNFITWRDVTLAEVVPNTTAADLALPIVDLSVVTTADQRHALPLPQTTSDAPYAWAGALVKVDRGERYTLSTWALNAAQYNETPLGFVSYDVDLKLIHPLHVTKYGDATDTTLAATLAPGDMSILITDASGWSNDPWESADTRSLAWYGYCDSTGHTYADYTYTRNVAYDFDHGLWEPGAVRYDASVGAYRVQLRAPWNGPTIEAGAAIRNAASGEVFSLPQVAPGLETSLEWVQYVATIGGSVWQDGQPSAQTFRPGTAYIQPVCGDTAHAPEVVVGPEQDFIYGGAEDPTGLAIEPVGDQQFVVDLDVLAGGAFGAAVGPLSGDYNADGAVDGADYTVWRDHLGRTGLVPLSGADGNGDGEVNEADFLLWRANFGRVMSVVVDSAAAAHGTATIFHGGGPGGRDMVEYLSDPWFVGTDVVTYTLRSTATGELLSSSVTVHVLGDNIQQDPALAATLADQALVTEGNEVPTAADDILLYVACAGQPVVADGVGEAVLANDSDPSDVLAARLISGPAHGTLSFNSDGTFVYTPEAGFTGADTFCYEAFDGLYAASAVVQIQVVASPEGVLLEQLHRVGLAMVDYSSSLHRFPVATNAEYFDAEGNPYLSWRVHILPYLSYQSLYDQFHLDEPWDSPHNLALVDQMPDVFRNPGDAAGATTTRLQVISGMGSEYYWRESGGLLVGPRPQEFTDGLTHSLLVVESAANMAVTWTRPDDLEFDPGDPLAALGPIGSDDIHAATADGSTITLSSSIDPATFAALVTIAGGEVVDALMLRRQYAEAHGGAADVKSYGMTAEDGYFKDISWAMLMFADSHSEHLPPSIAKDAAGNPFFSWRVLLLPYLGYQNLYEQFHFDEPWDSPNNLPLLDQMPDVYRSVGDPSDSTTTRVMVFTGPDAPFERFADGVPPQTQGPRLGDFVDGTFNTILFVEAGPDTAVPWTKPEDRPFDINDPLAALGDLSEGAIRAAMVDTTQMTIPADILSASFSALVTRSAASTYNGLPIPEEEVTDAATLRNREYLREGKAEDLQLEKNKFKQIALAMHAYEDSHSRFPVNVVDGEGTPLLSWRVLLLPYLEQGELYDQFHLDEPWDSPHNLALLDQVPDVYRSIGDPWDSTTTRATVFTGPGAPFPGPSDVPQIGPRYRDITDGTSNTIMVAESGSGNAVPWTKPTDTPFWTNNPFSPLGDLGSSFLAAFFDGHVEMLSASMTPSELAARITNNGGESLSDPPAIPTVPGFYVHQTAGDTVTGEFGVDWFDVVLDKAPESNVVLVLSVSNPAAATLDKLLVTFTPDDWDVPQRVALRAIDNHVVNADQVADVRVAVVASMSDDGYDAVPPQVFSALVLDDDAQSFLAGDYNADGAVDAADYGVWRDQLGATNLDAWSGPDGNGDGRLDELDFLAWKANFGATAPAVAVTMLSSPTAAEVGTDAVASPATSVASDNAVSPSVLAAATAAWSSADTRTLPCNPAEATGTALLPAVANDEALALLSWRRHRHAPAESRATPWRPEHAVTSAADAGGTDEPTLDEPFAQALGDLLWRGSL